MSASAEAQPMGRVELAKLRQLLGERRTMTPEGALLDAHDYWHEEAQSARRDVCRAMASSGRDYATPQDAARDMGWELDWSIDE